MEERDREVTNLYDHEEGKQEDAEEEQKEVWQVQRDREDNVRLSFICEGNLQSEAHTGLFVRVWMCEAEMTLQEVTFDMNIDLSEVQFGQNDESWPVEFEFVLIEKKNISTYELQ